MFRLAQAGFWSKRTANQNSRGVCMRFLFSLIALVGALFVLPATAQVIDVKVPGRAPAASPTDPENIWLLDLSTGGRVKIWLRPDVAPKMVGRLTTLTRRHFYDGLNFPRVIEGFMAKAGEPKGENGNASWMERGCQYESNYVDTGYI